MKSDRKFLKPKKGMTFDTGKMHNKRNNENKIAVTHIDRIQDYWYKWAGAVMSLVN